MKQNLFLCVLFVLAFAAGCTTEFNTATGRQETLMFGDEKEKSIGASVALEVEKVYKFDTDVDVNERAERILKRIVDVCDRQDLVYIIRIIDKDDKANKDNQVNAFSLPGGYVYVFKGLIELMGNDDQLAAVISHEVSHVVAKHSIKRMQGSYGALALQGLAIASGSGAAAVGVSLAADSVLFANSRADEFEADQLGIKYMKKAGYDPLQMRVMLERLLEYQNKQPRQPLSYWRTHPYIPERMARAEAEAKGKLEFRDYLNVTGEPK